MIYHTLHTQAAAELVTRMEQARGAKAYWIKLTDARYEVRSW